MKSFREMMNLYERRLRLHVVPEQEMKQEGNSQWNYTFDVYDDSSDEDKWIRINAFYFKQRNHRLTGGELAKYDFMLDVEFVEWNKSDNFKPTIGVTIDIMEHVLSGIYSLWLREDWCRLVGFSATSGSRLQLYDTITNQMASQNFVKSVHSFGGVRYIELKDPS